MLPSRDWVNEVPRMIATQEPESLYLEYKERGGLAPRREAGSIDKQTRAFDVSKHVSAFLNSDGGAILYGIRQDRDPLKTGGAPLPVFDPKQDGFALGDVTKEELENVITGNIYNRPTADLFNVSEVPIQGRVVLIVDIAQSLVGAFQAKDFKYYRRWNFKAEPMVNYEIEDVRSRASGPQLRAVIGLNEMWLQEQAVESVGDAEPVPVQLHCGLLNAGIRVAEVALFEFGLDTDVQIKGMPSQTVFRAGLRDVSWHVPQSGRSEDKMRWFHSRWTPQVFGTQYHPIFATEDPVHVFQLDLAAPPDKEGRLFLLPWRIQAPNTTSRTGLAAVDYRGGRITVTQLDWQLEVHSVLPM